MKGLIIREPWIGKILSGQKTWEIRKNVCNKRERIGLIRKGTNEVAGTAVITDCLGPMSVDELMKHQDKHGASRSDLVALNYTQA